jgi:hypothetical protein
MFHKKNKQRQISGVYDVQTDTGYADVGWGTNTGYQTAGYDVRGPYQEKAHQIEAVWQTEWHDGVPKEEGLMNHYRNKYVVMLDMLSRLQTGYLIPLEQ